MPYVAPKTRDALTHVKPKDPGELNFLITKLISEYCTSWGISYAIINDVVGALEGAKLEFYRRVAAPYEDSKIALNGDVYPPEILICAG